MKKMIIIFIFTIIICGCTSNNKEKTSDYEIYQLEHKELINHSYIDDENITRRYSLANITQDSSNAVIYGLFYKISEKKYKLMEKIEVSGDERDVFKFYENNLYVINAGAEANNLKYALNGMKFKKKELNFQFSQGFLIRSIQEVKKNEIYYNVYTNDKTTGNNVYVKLKCSLSTYKCEIN